MATVSTKGQGTWLAQIKIWSATDAAWKRVWRTTGIPALDPKAKAERVANALQEAALAVGPTETNRADRRLFAKMLEEIWRVAGLSAPAMGQSWRVFSAECIRGMDVTETSRVIYVHHCKEFGKFLGGRADAMLSEIGYPECQAFYDSLMASGRSHGTSRNYIKTLRAVFSRAVLLGMAPVNPALLVRLPMVQKVHRQAFTKEEIAKLLAYVDAEHPASDRYMHKKAGEWRIAIRLGLYCGMRLGDATHRNWEDFDLDAGTVTFIPQKKRKKGRPVVLPLLAPLLEHLRSIRKESGPVMPLLEGESNTSFWFGALLEKSGVIPPVVYDVAPEDRVMNRTIREKTFHSFRHTVLTELARTGADKQLRQLLADHEDPRVNDRYTHAEVERLAGALALAFPQ
jgi:integrase